MGLLASLTNQLGILLKSQSAARRIMLLIVALASLTGLGWMIIQAQTGGYTLLISNLRPAEGVEALAKLQQLGIKAKMENGGTSIQVPRNRFDDAIMMLSMEGIPSSGTVGYELMDKTSLGQSNFQQQKNYLRMREGELARTLLSIRQIQHAKVHLALPEDSLFVKDEKAATASVVLKLQRGSRLEGREVTGIVNLVSHSIEGLKSENVSVIDDSGNTLNQAHTEDSSQSSIAQQSYKLQYEEKLRNDIESQLENVVGKGKVSARVRADFNFSTQHQIRQSYNPEEQTPILRTEKTTLESTGNKSAGALQQGIPGSTSNLPSAISGVATNNGSTSGSEGLTRQDRTAEYAVSNTWEETQQSVPTPKQISVAVLVDYAETKDASGKVTAQPRTQQELADYEDLVKAAIGFVSTDLRTDQVKVLCSRFRTEVPEDLKDSLLNNYTVRQYIQLGVQWGIVGLIGLLLILMVLRPAVKQISVYPVELTDAKALPPGTAEAAAQGQLPPGKSAGAAIGSEGQGSAKATGQLGQRNVIGIAAGATEEDDDEFDLDDLPEEMRGNQDAIRQFKLQRLAAKQAKMTQAEADKIHADVMATARENPQKTVSLMRQWMEEP